MTKQTQALLAGITFISLWGCGAQRPVLYPNEALTRDGQERADAAIEECMTTAKQSVGSGGGATTETARDIGVGGASGAAIGAVGGAVAGNAGQGAAVGAATGATAGLLHNVFKRSEPDPVYRTFVERCLHDKGYEPIGWR